MKLSSHTTSVLKNFATINQNLVIKEGNSIATMSAMKNIVAKAEVEETFPQEIAIYDLNNENISTHCILCLARAGLSSQAQVQTPL